MQTPDLWQSAIVVGEEPPDKEPTDGHFPIGPWEPVTSFALSNSMIAAQWKRPLRKLNESLDSGDILR